jgi:hypothetical protein
VVVPVVRLTNLALAASLLCRSSKGLCDPEELCDGSSTTCPTDVLHVRGHVCRMKDGACDVADLCPGGDAQCPPDAKEVIDTPCRPAKDRCDVPELCDGSSKLCPPDEFRPASANFVCRDANGDCDLRETCDGTGVACPKDKFAVGVTCRAIAKGNTCDVAEVCVNSADCPPDGFMPFNSNCDDGSMLTTNDVCNSVGVCVGKCHDDMACDDRNKCTEDSCLMETGVCLFTPIEGCAPESTPTPPPNCLIDKSFRFDFLDKPVADADNVVVACFFNVLLAPINGTSVVRTFKGNSTRASSFGIAPLVDAKIRAETAVEMRFPPTWTAAIESVTVSSIGVDTLLAVVRDTPESQRANIDEALQAFDGSDAIVVTKGVWLIFKPGEHRAPPAIAFSPATAWTVMHLRGRSFSLDAVQLTRPVNEKGVEWQAGPGGTTVRIATTAPPDSAADAQLIDIVVGSVVGGLLLLCGTFAVAGMCWSRRRRRAHVAAADQKNSNAADNQQARVQYASIDVLHQNDYEMLQIAPKSSVPFPRKDYDILQIAPKLPGTDYIDGSELTNQNQS